MSYMKVAVLGVLFLTIGSLCFADDADSIVVRDNSFDFVLGVSWIPYFVEPGNQMDGNNVAVDAAFLLRLRAATLGIYLDANCNLIRRDGPDSTDVLLDDGIWMMFRAGAEFRYRFDGYVALRGGAGCVAEIAQYVSSNVPVDSSEFIYNRLGFSALFDILFDFNTDWFELSLKSRADIFEDTSVLYFGLKYSFAPSYFEGALRFFTEAGFGSWAPRIDEAWTGPGSEVTTESVYFTWTIGVVLDLAFARWDDPETGNTIDEKSINGQTSALDAAKTGDVVTFTTIMFLPDQAKIRKESLPVLEQIAQFLITNPSVTVELRGFTNALGSPDDELALSEARSGAMKHFMLGKGIDSHRIITVGYGSMFSKNTDIQDMDRNVEIRILGR